MTTQPKAHPLLPPPSIWLRSPFTILVSVVLGSYIGTFHHTLAEWIAPFGNLYLGLLKMCVLPILLSAITNSVGRLMKTQNAGHYIRRILVVFPVGLVLVSLTATTLAAIMGPGRNLTASTLETLGVVVNTSGIDVEVSLTGPIAQAEAPDLAGFLINMVPDNIFSALSDGQTLKVLVFAIIFGVSLGFVQERATGALFDILESIYKTFDQLMNWLTLALPLALCSLLAYQLSKLGMDVMISMLNFIVVAIATFVLIYVLSTLVIWRHAHRPLASVFAALKAPTILALATSSSLACLPTSISTLSEDLKFDRQTVNLVAPLSITLCRFGSVIYFALATLFVAQLYQAPLNFAELTIVVVCSIFAGMATSGVTGILTLTMLNLVLEPLKLPLEAVLALFIAIDPIMDPFRTLGIVHTGMAATAVIADVKQQSR